MHNNDLAAWIPDPGDGTYRNPIVYADYSDPDAIRVGDDFFMVSSSFSHVPGLPLLHSRDLVNWRIVNHVIDRLELPGYDTPQHGKGVWAPSIRYHDGKFWVFFGAPDEGIYMSTAEDPFGRWTPLHQVVAAKGRIDPCPFWDEDGQAYLVHAFAHSRCGIKHKLNLCRMSPDGKELLDEGQIVFDGAERHPTMEGPKMYKRNGYYYIFAPAGGVRPGWQTVLRSKSVYGPYEDKIVLHQGGTPVNGPHQGAWVELATGESWVVKLKDPDADGRIVHLQPMTWENDWPLIGLDANGDGIGEPVLRHRKPNVGGDCPATVPDTTDEFAEEKLGLQWQWQANPQPSWYSLAANPGHLRLYSAPLPDSAETLYDAPQLLMQKFPAPAFSAATWLAFAPEAEGDLAGLIVFGFTYRYLALSRPEPGRFKLTLVEGRFENEASREREVAAVRLDPGPVELKVDVAGEAECRFGYRIGDGPFLPIGDAFRARECRWVGAKMGIFAVNRDRRPSGGYADFDGFRVRPLGEEAEV